MYFAGHVELADADMKALYADTKNLHAFDFVVDDLVVMKDTAKAEAMLEEYLKIAADHGRVARDETRRACIRAMGAIPI